MKTVKKALDLLDLFLNENNALKFSEIAKRSGFNKSTVHNILSDLVDKRFLRHAGPRGNYSLGYKFFEFTTAINHNFELREIAYPYMEELCRTVNENVNLGILDSGHSAVQIEMIISNNTLNIIGKPEASLSLYDSGLGKVLLAYQAEEKWEFFKTEGILKAKTEYTITNYNKLIEHLLGIIKEGFGIDDQERELGVCNIAAPIRDFNGKVIAAIGIIGPSIRIHQKGKSLLIKTLKQYCEKISEALGYTTNHG